MASDLNQCTFTGRLGSDPELRSTANGKPVANFSLAVNGWDGHEETVTWLKGTVWDKLAESCQKFLNKGDKVTVSGRYGVRKYQDRDGNERESHEFTWYSVIFPSKPRGQQQQGNDNRQTYNPQSKQGGGYNQNQGGYSRNDEDDI